MDNNFSIVFVQMQGIKTEKMIGGGLTFLELLARNLIKRNIRVYAITNSRDKYGFDFLANNRFIANFNTNPNGLLSMFFFDYTTMKNELHRIIDKLPKNCIFISVDPFPRDIFSTYYIKRYLQQNTIITMHHITPSIFFHPFRRGFSRTIIAWLMSVFALFIIKTSQIPVFLDNKRIAASTGWRLDHLLMEMPLTVNIPIKNPNNKYNQIACFIGRLNPNKGITDLIYSWRLVNRSIPDAKLYIIGGNVAKDKYQKLLNRLNMNNTIKITGYLSESEKNQIISMSSLFVFPSYEEGWSLAVMEAINYGLLPILYDIPAYYYVCNDKIKVPPGNIKELSTKIVYFLNNPEKVANTVRILQMCSKKYSEDYVFDVWFNQIKEKFNLT